MMMVVMTVVLVVPCCNLSAHFVAGGASEGFL